jgi:hypothetical protein
MPYNMHDGEDISLSTNTMIFLRLENDILKTNNGSVICSCSSRCVFNNLYTNLSVNNTPCLFISLFSIILGYMFWSHGPSSGLQHYHNTDPNYCIVTIEISTALHGKLCFSVKTQTKSRLSP